LGSSLIDETMVLELHGTYQALAWACQWWPSSNRRTSYRPTRQSSAEGREGASTWTYQTGSSSHGASFHQPTVDM